MTWGSRQTKRQGLPISSVRLKAWRMSWCMLEVAATAQISNSLYKKMMTKKCRRSLLLVLSVFLLSLPSLGQAFISFRLLDTRSASSAAAATKDGEALGMTMTPVCTYQTITIHPPSSAGTNGTNNGNNDDNDSTPRQTVSVADLTPHLHSFLSSSGMLNGVLHVISQHTTTAITINERESRLAQDIANYFLEICPPDERSSSNKSVRGVRYLHNDIEQRPDGEEESQRCRENGWDIDNIDELQRWRDQEPINAHSHLISMMLGSSECIPVVNGQMAIGQWQSVLMVDLDGPRKRSVGVQALGYR